MQSEIWDKFGFFERNFVRTSAFIKANFKRLTKDNWGALMNYAVLASFDSKYMKSVIRYYNKARMNMISKLKGPNGHLVIGKRGFVSTCCREMHDAIIFKEIDLNFDYKNLFSSIRVDSMEKGKIDETDRCPYCGAKIEGIKVVLSE